MLSIVVSWRDRDELPRSLPLLLETARLAGGDVTVVNYGGNQQRLSGQLQGLQCESLRLVHVVGEQYFNKARAQNVGAGATSHPVLFFCDCDILVEPSLLVDLAGETARRPGIFATLAGVIESERNSRRAGNVVCFGYELDIRLANGRRLKIVDNEEDAQNGSRQAPGLLLARRADFIRIEGYNGQLHGWGWEDQDMIARLTLGAGLTRIQRGVVTHLSHGDADRIANYPPVRDRWESRDRMFRQALSNYDCNRFTGTYTDDNARLNLVVNGQERQAARH
jgi:hypothetical protein